LDSDRHVSRRIGIDDVLVDGAASEELSGYEVWNPVAVMIVD
jgi:hypothetical protein